MKLVHLAALAFVTSLQFAQGRAIAADAGFRNIEVPGAAPITVALYYPTSAPAARIPMGPFPVQVAWGAPADQPLKGLVLLSHGTGGTELGHHDLATRLAKEGYLVAAPRHPGDNWRDGRTLVAEGRYFDERPRQASRVLDALLASPDWNSRIPAGRIAAIGHSAGGYTVLALAGGQPDPSRIAAHCRSVTDDAGFCALGKAGLEAGPRAAAAPSDPSDPRIRAVVAMAPVGVVFKPGSLAAIKVPVRLYAASLDTVLVPKYHGDALAAAMQQATYRRIEGAGHFAFMAQPTQSLGSDAGDPAANPPGFDRPAFLATLADEVVAFLDGALR